MKKLFTIFSLCFFALFSNSAYSQITKSLYVASPCLMTGNNKDLAGLNNFSLDVYPSPGNGNFFLKFPVNMKKGEINIFIYNTSGSLLMNKKLYYETSPVALDLTGTAKGLYLIRVVQGKENGFRKIVIN